MKLIAFAASTSKQSINKKLVVHAAQLFTELREDALVEILDLNDYDVPLFNVDKEKETGEAPGARAFYNKLGEADALLVSFAEHNGNYTAAYKNLYDWISRIDKKVYRDKPTVFLATSPGARGAQGVLKIAVASASLQGVELKASLSIPSFFKTFDQEKRKLIDSEYVQKLYTCLEALL